jgi:hypothetical protein
MEWRVGSLNWSAEFQPGSLKASTKFLSCMGVSLRFM